MVVVDGRVFSGPQLAWLRLGHLRFGSLLPPHSIARKLIARPGCGVGSFYDRAILVSVAYFAARPCEVK
jgi:hypothetical protein